MACDQDGVSLVPSGQVVIAVYIRRDSFELVAVCSEASPNPVCSRRVTG